MVGVVSIRKTKEAGGHRGSSLLRVTAQCCRCPDGPRFDGPWFSEPLPRPFCCLSPAVAAAAFCSLSSVLPALSPLLSGSLNAVLK